MDAHKTYYTYELWTRRDPVWKEYRDLMYDENHRKRITLKLLEKVGPLALAVWIMDDGHYHKGHGQISLYTHRYGYDQNVILKSWFEEKWGISPTIATHHVRGKEMFHLYFPKKEARGLIEIIKPYVVPSMAYKIGAYVEVPQEEREVV